MKQSGHRHHGERLQRSLGTAFAVFSLILLVVGTAALGAQAQVLQAGAAAIDITPTELPVRVLGSFLERTANGIAGRIYARALVLDDGNLRLALVVVDSCMVPRELIDQAKELAAEKTGIPTDRIVVAATHTHSAPAAMGGLGTRCDEKYPQFLVPQMVEAVVAAIRNLVPARIGWAAVDVPQYTHCRRWVLRSDKIQQDPFGERTVRANMHPGYQNPDFTSPAGPVDTGLTVLSLQSRAGRALAVLGNYSQHYKGAASVSGDYYTRFDQMIEKLVSPDGSEPPVVGIMSQGTSGDLQWMDYSQPKKDMGLDEYAQALANIAHAQCREMTYHDWVPLGMVERKITLRRRTPDSKRLAWAEQVRAQMKGPVARNQPEVYALEAFHLQDEPVRELKLQALRIGDLGICAIPDEVYGITGIKLKEQSPFATQFNMELANGGEGYIPPPFQHKFGGYTTWPARTAGLEEQTEVVITENLLEMLEELADRPRRKVIEPQGTYVRAVLASKPLAYWRMNEYSGPTAFDCTGNGHHGQYEDLIAFYLPGPEGERFSGDKINRCALFAGGRMRARAIALGDRYTVSLWFWNGFPADARAVTGYLFSRGPSGERGDHLGLGGTEGAQGKLFFSNGDRETGVVLAGRTEIPLRTWTHVALVRQGARVRVYLNGKLEIAGESPLPYPADFDTFYLGGRCDRQFCFEGRMDEAAVYDRAWTGDPISE